MSKRITEGVVMSSPEWDEMEDWLRGRIQNIVQDVPEEELTGFWADEVSALVPMEATIEATGTVTTARGS